MKITIIGCGYVGTAIAQRLAFGEIAKIWSKAGHHLTLTTTTPGKISQLSTIASEVVILQGNDRDTMTKVIEDREVILFTVGAKQRDPDTYRQAYLETANNLVAAVQQTNTVKQIIYTGTHAVLGNQQGQWVDEQCPYNPLNENGEILCQTEETILSAQNQQLNTCILRLEGIYGQGRELINIFRTWAGTTRPGNGQDYTNWVHLDDIVQAIALACQQQLQGIYNLSSDEPLTKQEFYHRLFTTHNLPPLNWDENLSSSPSFNVRLVNQKIKTAGLQLIHPQIEF
jgi:nucleoside-diphosphate-sugar epimerase